MVPTRFRPRPITSFNNMSSKPLTPHSPGALCEGGNVLKRPGGHPASPTDNTLDQACGPFKPFQGPIGTPDGSMRVAHGLIGVRQQGIQMAQCPTQLDRQAPEDQRHDD